MFDIQREAPIALIDDHRIERVGFAHRIGDKDVDQPVAVDVTRGDADRPIRQAGIPCVVLAISEECNRIFKQRTGWARHGLHVL